VRPPPLSFPCAPEASPARSRTGSERALPPARVTSGRRRGWASRTARTSPSRSDLPLDALAANSVFPAVSRTTCRHRCCLRGNTKQCGWSVLGPVKNRIPKPSTFPHCGFAAPCGCDEAERQGHGQAPRDGHLLSERRRMGLDLFVVRATRSREGVLEQGQRAPIRAYRTRESGQ
jgi:hypothetical protein